MNEDQRSTDLKRFIRDVPDFPKPGILFKDITPLLGDRRAFTTAIDLLTELHVQDKIDMVLGIESRGFLFGAPLALRLGAGFVPVRKPGKLPADKVREEYALEYGTDAVEMHRDAVVRGARVLGRRRRDRHRRHRPCCDQARWQTGRRGGWGCVLRGAGVPRGPREARTDPRDLRPAVRLTVGWRSAADAATGTRSVLLDRRADPPRVGRFASVRQLGPVARLGPVAQLAPVAQLDRAAVS
jgi:hypothetical protein